MTEPLAPATADLRDFDGFMLNVERLLASELWALSTGDQFKAAMALWCRAWKQVPAGSLPNDEKVLAAFSGAKSWAKVRSIALRGFELCSDGRLYHRTLCEDVVRALKAKADRHERTKAATEARQKQRNEQRGDERDVPQNTPVTTSHRQDRTGQEEIKKIISGSVPRPAGSAKGSPDYSDPAVRKQRWLQKLTPEIVRQLGPENGMATLEAYERGDPLAKQTIEAIALAVPKDLERKAPVP